MGPDWHAGSQPTVPFLGGTLIFFLLGAGTNVNKQKVYDGRSIQSWYGGLQRMPRHTVPRVQFLTIPNERRLESNSPVAIFGQVQRQNSRRLVSEMGLSPTNCRLDVDKPTLTHSTKPFSFSLTCSRGSLIDVRQTIPAAYKNVTSFNTACSYYYYSSSSKADVQLTYKIAIFSLTGNPLCRSSSSRGSLSITTPLPPTPSATPTTVLSM
jgi:hypothetical protein